MNDTPQPRDRRTSDDDPLPPPTPYGPHYAGVDESAGADSSPLDTESTRSAPDKADSEARDQGHTERSGPPDGRSPCQAPPGWW